MRKYAKFKKTQLLGPDHHLLVVPSGQRRAGLAAEGGPQVRAGFTVRNPPSPTSSAVPAHRRRRTPSGGWPPVVPHSPIIVVTYPPHLPPVHTPCRGLYIVPLRAAREKRARQAPARPPRGAQVRDNGRKTGPGGLAPSVTRISSVASLVPSPRPPRGHLHSGLCLEGGLPRPSAGGAP